MPRYLGGDAQTHDPAPLGDATVADESELFEQALWPGMQVGATLRVTSSHLLGVGLDQASASMRLSRPAPRQLRPAPRLCGGIRSR